MPKTLSGGLASHLGQEVTTLATLWRLTRTDGEEFFFTDHDEDIVFEGNTYEAAVGYNRTAVANQVGLAVDNLDVQGFLDSTALTDHELRAGLFDFAEVRVMVVNYVDLAQGVLRLRRGRLGEVLYSDSGIFQTELRGLTQAYSQNIVEIYEPECRADLGDERCMVPILPPVVLRNTAYVVGDFVRMSPALAGLYIPTLLVPGDTDAEDISVNGATATLGTQATVQSVVSMFGGGAIEFSPSGSADPSQAFVSYPDNAEYTIGTRSFTIEAWVRFKDLTSTIQVIMSQYLNTGNQRAWIFERNGDELRIRWSNSGTALDVSIAGSFTFLVDTWYHVAVTRDFVGDVRLFVDGVQVGSTTSNTTSIFNSTSVLYLGKIRSASFDDLPLDGFIDDAQLVVGFPLYTANFTPPVAAHTVDDIPAAIEVLITEDFEDLIYECITAGLTGAGYPDYDSVIGNQTLDGSAVFEAAEAWTRAAEVTGVTDNRTFTISVTEPRAVDNWFKFGAVRFDTGNNENLAMEVKEWIQSTNTVTLFLSMPFDIEVGDKLSIYAGCDKKLSTCIAKFDNVVNFRGEPYVPGPDAFLSVIRVPDASSAGRKK
jgi:hypothetical protein